MSSQKIFFENKNGQKLAGYLDLPVNNKPLAFALFAHCFTCSKNSNAIKNISTGLKMKGFAVLRFDFTGLGESEGDFSDTNFSSNVDDLIAAADFLAENYEAPKLLIGHSFGGAAVLLAAEHIEASEAIVTIGAPSNTKYISKTFEEEKEKIIENGEATVNLAGRKFKIKKQFIDDIEKVHLEEKIKNLDKALLIMHAPSDEIVGIENAKDIYDAASHPKSFVSLVGADHLLSKKEDSLYVADVISSWAGRYITIPASGISSLKSESQVVAKTEEKYFTEVAARQHNWIADEPENYGGSDLGPTPYDLLAASLATCTSMTIRFYADKKNFPLDSVLTHVDHEKKHAEDCEGCEDDPTKKIDHLIRKIEVKGDLSKEQKEKLLEIANKCPVHRTLNSDIRIETSLVK